jgi:crooked neck
MKSKKFNFKDLKENSLDYDTWFDYLRLLENEEDLEQIRDAYEKAIAQVPPINVIFILIIIMKKSNY